MPQAAGRPLAQPAVPTGFADDPFVMINIGYSAYCCCARFQYLTKRMEEYHLEGKEPDNVESITQPNLSAEGRRGSYSRNWVVEKTVSSSIVVPT